MLFDRLSRVIYNWLEIITSWQRFLCSLQPSGGKVWTMQAQWNAPQDLETKILRDWLLWGQVDQGIN